MNKVALELVRQALRSGIKAKLVLFDSWFSSPYMFDQFKHLRINGLGMVKEDLLQISWSVKERLRHSRHSSTRAPQPASSILVQRHSSSPYWFNQISVALGFRQ